MGQDDLGDFTNLGNRTLVGHLRGGGIPGR
jgi:hypothetical protein